MGLVSFKCSANEKEGGGGLGYRDNRKICTYTCTSLKTNRHYNVISNSDMSDGDSRFCRGAEIATTYSPLTGGRVGVATHYEPFIINTDNWWWDGWGSTQDIFDQLKGIEK